MEDRFRHRIVEIGPGTMSCLESRGTRGPVLLLHGNSLSQRVFLPQLMGTPAEDYRLIALDLPGHGDSFRFSRALDYSLPAYAESVAQLCEALDITRPVLCGWSLGGHVALEAIGGGLDARALVIWGTPPLGFPPDMERAFLPQPLIGLGFTGPLTRDQAWCYARSFFSCPEKAPEEPFVDDIMRSDPRAREGLGLSIRPDGYRDEITVAASLAVPTMVIHGARDSFVSLPYLQGLKIPSLEGGTIRVVPDAGHAAHWEQPELFNHILGEFLDGLG